MRKIGSLTSADTWHVDGKLYRGTVFAKVFPVAQRSEDHPLGELVHVVVAGAGQEQAGRNNPARWVARAYKRFGADEVRRPKFDLGLIPELHPVVPQHRAEWNRRLRVGIGYRPRREQISKSSQHAVLPHTECGVLLAQVPNFGAWRRQGG